MAWDDEMVIMLRAMVNDLDSTKYTDDTLTTVLALAAYQVQRDLQFPANYVVSVSNQTLSPDPTDPSTLDESFTNLVTIKAACITDRSAAVTATDRAIAVKDGTSAIDLREMVKGKLALLKSGGWCAAYDDAKLNYLTSNGIAGAIIMTPFRTRVGGFYAGPRNDRF